MSRSGLSDGRARSLAATLPAGPTVASNRVLTVPAAPLGPWGHEESRHAGGALRRSSEAVADREVRGTGHERRKEIGLVVQ
eukprot:3255129-Alexandrium_andersonii.AAC.1